ncbi:MAG: SDR family oxidoreductase [Alphaproteobacteria bacterium]|nr:SDR family oxidoreductase [Alphaproteobacteria bacterium]
MSLMGVVAVIGGSRGLGATVSAAAAKAGYAVAVGYAADAAAATAVVADIGKAGGRAGAFQVDITSRDSVGGFLAAAGRAFGKVTGVANCAGFSGGRKTLAELDQATLDRVLAVNVSGAFNCAQAAIAHMRGKGGAIVNVSSAVVSTGGFRLAHYAAAKGAIEALTRSLAWEAAEAGVRINAVAPGAIAGEGAGTGSNYAKSAPLQREARPDEVAAAILWLLSDASSYITGAVIPVTGGR